MINFSRWLVNLIFMVRIKVTLFKLQNPNEEVLATGGTKAVNLGEDKQISRGLHWVVSKRAVLILTRKRLICGSWSINLQEIKNAQVYKIASILGEGLVLKIQTEENKFYQFGLQYDPAWINQNVINLEIVDGYVL